MCSTRDSSSKPAARSLTSTPRRATGTVFLGADLILLTDIHGDHLAPALIAKVRKPGAGTQIIALAAVAKTVTDATVINNVAKPKPSESGRSKPSRMYNIKRGPSEGKLFPRQRPWQRCYVLTYGGLAYTLRAIPKTSLKCARWRENIDVAFVPMNLPYDDDARRSRCRSKSVPSGKVVYPYHYMGSDTKAFAAALAGAGIDVRLRDWY